jgi:SAM-dependent methyltransferase
MSETGPGGVDPRRYAPAAARNRQAILSVLAAHLPTAGTVLEVASGTGEHAAYFAPRLGPDLIWQPSDLDPDAAPGIDAHAADAAAQGRIRPALNLDVGRPDWQSALSFDAVFCANMIHIAPFAAAEGLIRGAGAGLPDGGPLILYGPFRRDGVHTAPSNADFDDSLKARDPSWGVRDLEGEIVPLAAAAGLTLSAVEAMPANNLTVIFRRGPTAT